MLDKDFSEVPEGMSPVAFVFDDASPEQFRYVEQNGQVTIDPTSAVGIWLDFAKTHPGWKNRATFCLLNGGAAGHNFFGDKDKFQGQKNAWRFQKVKWLADQGFEILATAGTAEVLRRNGVDCTVVRKHFEGSGPHGEKTTVQLIHDGEIGLIVNTPYGAGSGGNERLDGYEIRTAAVMANVPCITTVQGLGAAVQGIEAMRRGDIGVRSLQEWAAR